MQNVIAWLDTGILLAIFVLGVGFGRWTVLKLWEIQTKLEKICDVVPKVEKKGDRTDIRMDKMEVVLAAHCATPHCGEEGKKKAVN